ncbi:hypothetical protein [Sphingobium baderi]|uniref:hypothetical protein n=1 Tax=Sphingobium baderi TaxID=1332080 RepID=UPI0004CF9B12|nr:hypothetical protein [Sphingobium baderi]KMS64022.1 hypothetical protein V475_23200 [Sphingobium baderi LL03]
MTLYSEASYFDGDHCQHVADREDRQRLERKRHETREALSMRYGVAPHWGKTCADMDAQISRAFHWGRGKSA